MKDFVFNLCTITTVTLTSLLLDFTVIRLAAAVANCGFCAGGAAAHHTHSSDNSSSQVSLPSAIIIVWKQATTHLWSFQIEEAPQGQQLCRHWNALHWPAVHQGPTDQWQSRCVGHGWDAENPTSHSSQQHVQQYQPGDDPKQQSAKHHYQWEELGECAWAPNHPARSELLNFLKWKPSFPFRGTMKTMARVDLRITPTLRFAPWAARTPLIKAPRTRTTSTTADNPLPAGIPVLPEQWQNGERSEWWRQKITFRNVKSSSCHTRHLWTAFCT